MAKKDSKIISSLYRVAKAANSLDEVMTWIDAHRATYSMTQMLYTLKEADMADVAEFLIESVDAKVGDIVRSRSTARIGKIIGIHADGSTVDVKWDSGGKQAMSKEYLVKLSNKENTNKFKTYTTENDYYAGMKDPQIFVRDAVKLHREDN